MSIRFWLGLFCSAMLIVMPGCGDDDPGNRAPVADAGADQNVATGSRVTLDASASSDADGNPLTYRWQLLEVPAGSSAALSDAAAVRPSLTVDREGTYRCELVVNDGMVDSDPDTVTITAATANSAPVADAGPDQNVATGSLVTLDAGGSSDADGDPLSYRWQLADLPAGSSAALSALTGRTTTFVADQDGVFRAVLIVNDGLLDSAPDSVAITAATANSVPVADAGLDQSVAVGSLVTLNAGGSSDADGDPLSYSWSLLSTPTGSSAALSATDVVAPTITVDLAGDYVLQLIVNDGLADSAADTVTITAVAPLILTGTWTVPELLQTDRGYDNSRARAAINASGDGVVSWSQGNPFVENATLANTYEAAAGSWVAPASVEPFNLGAADPSSGSASAPGIDATGTAAVAREVVPPTAPNRIYVFDFDPVTTTWSGGTPLVTASELSVNCEVSSGGNDPEASYPHLAMNGTGQTIIAWENRCGSSYGWYTNIYVSRYDPAIGTWTVGVRLDNYYSEARDPVTAINGTGRAALAWTHDPPQWNGAAAEGLYAAVDNNTLGNWSVAQIADGTVAAISEQQLVIDPAGNVTLVWSWGLQIFWARYDANLQSWSAPARLDAAVDSADQPAIAADGEGNLLVTWRQSNTDLVSRRYVAATATWQAPVVMASGLTAPTNVGLGVDDAGHGIALYNSNSHPTAQRYNAETGTWSTAERLDTSAATVAASSLDLAVSGSGQTLATWTQSPDDAGLGQALPFAVRLE